MTLPKGKPKEITSASVTSLGSLRTWITRDGTPALLLSPLNFLLSFPLAVKSKSYCLLEWVWKNMHTYNFWHTVCAPHPVITLYYKEISKSNLTRVWRHMAFFFFPKLHDASDIAECHCNGINSPVAILQPVYSTHPPTLLLCVGLSH